MLRLKLLIMILFCSTFLLGQKIDKVYLNENDSTKNCYAVIYPPALPWTGYVVIIPGFGETAESVLEQTDLPRNTALHGLLTVIPTLKDGVFSFGVDSASQESLHRIIEDVRSRHKLMDQRFFIGGFSIGGSCAIKYAQNAKLKPKAVFAIDPPLDFERLYNSCKRDVRLSVDKEASQENLYLIERIEKEFSGSPKEVLPVYHSISPYSFSDKTQSALKKFGNIPLRIYAEPDVQWWLRERNSDLTAMNVTDCSAMINELNRLGNHQAELVLTENKGFRKTDNSRHPHSWSIVDSEVLIEWMLK